MLDEFEKQNPDIKVEMETTPWDQYWVKLEAATTGGNMPDVVTMHSSESYKYMSQNALMGLDDVIKEMILTWETLLKELLISIRLKTNYTQSLKMLL